MKISVFATLLSATAFAPASFAQHTNAPAANDALLIEFKSPPKSARPRVWWHWMNGNVTKDGIRKDLEWMKRSGIGGLQNFDANLLTPQVVDHRLIYMHPEWKDAFKFAATTAHGLGLEMAIASSPGWSQTGGPWVKPEDGLKKLVWTNQDIVGGKRFRGRLARPTDVSGPFMDLPLHDDFAGLTGEVVSAPPRAYSDVAILAFPLGAPPQSPLPAAGKINGVAADMSALADNDLESGVDVAVSKAGASSTITYTYARPQTMRSATLFIPGLISLVSGSSLAPRLEASTDGKTWHKVAQIPAEMVPTTVAFSPVTATAFRLVLDPEVPAPLSLGVPAAGVDLSAMAAFMRPPAKTYKVTNFRLSGEVSVDQYERKAGFALVPDYYALSTDLPDMAGIDPDKVVNLTSRLKSDGTLDWTPPAGHWRVVRLGWSLIGTTNHPATAEATGLEVDKFDGEAVQRYLDHYIGMYKDAAGEDLIGAKGVNAFLTDSIEVGAANWTPKMIEQFRQRRGYDPTPYMPALTGVVIGSRAKSDKFLYDYRRTLADLIASEHYGTVAKIAHNNGMIVYGEALENGRPNLGDDMAMRSHTDVPMAAMWTFGAGASARPAFIADIRGAASVAHLYGQNVVAAESMTSILAPWAFAPHDLRRVVDLEFANGVNRPVVHTSVHSPGDDKQPGLSLSVFGQYFNRHETWAEMARPWVDYLARSSYLLQQGRNYADVAYFYGEEAPLTALYKNGPVTDAPVGYAYDFANADVVQNVLSVENGEIVAKSGARYMLLYLGGASQRMTVPVLRRLAALAEAGATIVGNRPASSPSLRDETVEFGRLTKTLWAGGPVTRVGKGRVIAGQDLQRALRTLGLAPDFTYSKPAADTNILFIHRRLADGDVYFVNNRGNRPEEVEGRFRVTGKVPEIWRADTGTVEPVSYRIEDGQTIVPLKFEPEDSFFVVFRRPSSVPSMTVVTPAPQGTVTLEGPWNVIFPAGSGAPAAITLQNLAPLNAQAEPGVKYFSGVATYTKQFRTSAGYRSGSSMLLDLGKVGDLAEVRVNGVPVGTVWHAPFRIDIGGALKAGENTLEVRVANLWVNRLIGDQQPGATKITYASTPTYTPKAPLRPSGLIGPVTIAAYTK